MPPRGLLFNGVAESSPIDLQCPVSEADELLGRVAADAPEPLEPKAPCTVHLAHMLRDEA